MQIIGCISIQILLNFVSNGPIENESVLVQIMTRRLFSNKSLSEPVMT